MSTEPIIVARGLGKRYRIGGQGGRYKTLREGLVELAGAPLRMFRARKRDEDFWALKDVSFTVGRGEAVGIIGRNGAGKSTLLKVLSRITAPSTGSIRLRGRVASLLEVGTGFHPELTGRENIFLNGAIMGMKRAEIRARFDEIVAFAEVEKFLDTPVKRYSSGMYVRLAFAVAAHLQPEILVVDEVLAVGDSSFQKKCMGKMQDVASGGRTVLFVSHNMAAIARLCSRAILLKGGSVQADDVVHKVVSTYIGGTGDSPAEVDFERGLRTPGSEDARLLGARIRSEGKIAAVIDIRHPVEIEIDFEVLRQRHPIHPAIHVWNDEGNCVFISSDGHMAERQRPTPTGRYRIRCMIPGNFLAEGMLSVDVSLGTHSPVIIHAWERGLLAFHVHDPADGTTVRGTYGGPYPGIVRPELAWKLEPLDEREKGRNAS